MRGYREIIVRLKEEFIKAEAEKALAEVRMKARDDGGGAISISPDELKDLHEGLRQAKEDFEKLSQEKQTSGGGRDSQT